LEENYEGITMRETLVVSSRGQITLPARLRKRMGINSGDVVILEEHGNEIVLKPGIVFEVDHYSDGQIAQWDIEDKLSEHERDQILHALTSPVK
jgi:AbrB family looped-hinge helix DNA binding protein